MKSQRYPFSDIRNDIESAETITFTYSDLYNMLVNEPFYLTPQYTSVFLEYCFDKIKIDPKESISKLVLIAKLRKVIDDFQLMSQEQ